MGKVKVRIVGDEAAEQEQKNEQKQKNEAKKARGLNMGGGQRINSVGPTEEEIMAENPTQEVSKEEGKSKKARGNKNKVKEAKVKSKRYTESATHVAKSTTYPLQKGIEILRKFKKSNFDETVELHINVKEKGISGAVSLPHGTGKKLKIVIADESIIEAVEKGKIDFDILVATPQLMPQLARVARILGPKGLMPNPKNGTISDKPEEVVKKLAGGQVTYKTEPIAPIIHQAVGKLSFEDKQITENISTLIASIGPTKINSVVLKSTMSPAIKLAY